MAWLILLRLLIKTYDFLFNKWKIRKCKVILNYAIGTIFWPIIWPIITVFLEYCHFNIYFNNIFLNLVPLSSI